MGDKSSDFNRFLKINYPDEWRRFSAPDVKDDVINSILMRFEKKYEIWKRIPEWIKDFYGDLLPKELLNGNEPYNRFIEDIEKRVIGELSYDRDKLNDTIYRVVMEDDQARLKVSHYMENGGYKFETSCNIVYKFMEQKRIIEDDSLSDEEKRILHTKIWGEVRNLIEEDWKENQVCKYVNHMAKEYDRALVRSRKAKLDGNDRKVLEEKIKAFKSKKQFEAYLEKIDDVELKSSYRQVMDAIVEKHRKMDEDEKMPADKFVKKELEKQSNCELKSRVNANLSGMLR
ncbi:MAG: hypothetical protein IKW39_05235 [Alphaproteobacteria bacterium]|nr:hypothetical protein [Alphaproteobacteria bacterium]